MHGLGAVVHDDTNNNPPTHPPAHPATTKYPDCDFLTLSPTCLGFDGVWDEWGQGLRNFIIPTSIVLIIIHHQNTLLCLCQVGGRGGVGWGWLGVDGLTATITTTTIHHDHYRHQNNDHHCCTRIKSTSPTKSRVSKQSGSQHFQNYAQRDAKLPRIPTLLMPVS